MTQHDPGFACFLDVANKTSAETYEKLRGPLQFLEEIDRLFVDFIPDAGPIKPATAAILILNSHASYRAAIRLALSGQILPIFMTLRGCIESALYANAMVVKPGLQDVWLKRDRDDATKQLCRNEFTTKKVFEYLAQVHEKQFADGLKDAYESTIDFGAHPNSHSVVKSIRIEEIDTGDHALEFTYIHGAGSFELRQSLIACAEIGVLVFFVALICFPDHKRVKELNDRTLELQAAMPRFINDLGLNAENAPVQ